MVTLYKQKQTSESYIPIYIKFKEHSVKNPYIILVWLNRFKGIPA